MTYVKIFALQNHSTLVYSVYLLYSTPLCPPPPLYRSQQTYRVAILQRLEPHLPPLFKFSTFFRPLSLPPPPLPTFHLGGFDALPPASQPMISLGGFAARCAMFQPIREREELAVCRKSQIIIPEG